VCEVVDPEVNQYRVTFEDFMNTCMNLYMFDVFADK